MLLMYFRGRPQEDLLLAAGKGMAAETDRPSFYCWTHHCFFLSLSLSLCDVGRMMQDCHVDLPGASFTGAGGAGVWC